MSINYAGQGTLEITVFYFIFSSIYSYSFGTVRPGSLSALPSLAPSIPDTPDSLIGEFKVL